MPVRHRSHRKKGILARSTNWAKSGGGIDLVVGRSRLWRSSRYSGSPGGEPMPKRHVVELTEDQRDALARREDGPLTRRQRNRVQILLRSDAGETDEEIADALGVSVGTAANARRRFTRGGLDAAIDEKPRPGAKPVLDGKGEAIVIATACSPVPEGRAT